MEWDLYKSSAPGDFLHLLGCKRDTDISQRARSGLLDEEGKKSCNNVHSNRPSDFNYNEPQGSI